MSIVREGWKNIVAVYVLLVLLLSSHGLLAQSGKGLITGSVVDDSNATLNGAQVQLLPLGLISVANNQGTFAFPEIPAGKYTLAVSYVGFKPMQKDVQLTAGQCLSDTHGNVCQ